MLGWDKNMTTSYNKSQYVALEGPAFAGKTTLLRHLEKMYPSLVISVPEASEYVGGDKHFPSIPFATFEDAKASTHFFLELEKMRCEQAQKAAAHYPNKIVILDRITLLSSVLFYDLLESNFPDLHNFSESFKQHALEISQKALDAGDFFIPEKVILVLPKNKTTFESRLSRGAKNSMFGHWSSVEFLTEKYQNIFMRHFRRNVLVLETENTLENLESCAAKVIAFLENRDESANNTNIFTQYAENPTNAVYNPNLKEEKIKYVASRDRARELIERTLCQQE